MIPTNRCIIIIILANNSEYLKKTLARDMLVMPYETTQSSEKMPLTFKINNNNQSASGGGV